MNMKEKLFGIFKIHNIHKRKEKGAGVAAQRSRLPLPVTNEQKNSA